MSLSGGGREVVGGTRRAGRLHASRGGPDAGSGGGGPGAPPARRRDIEGLRAVAIAAVVIYHARPSALPGGYVGVDVFFVVSGFVITSMLLGELGISGAISARRFYAARARRLLPSAAVVVAATAIASALLLAPTRLPGLTRDALASTFFVANYRFALEASNYLTASGPLSPYQHFWSLGVEEQFYLLWPLLLAGGSLAWTRSRQRPSTVVLAVVMALVAAASFALCWHLTATDEPWAFYSLPTRAFELAAGGLVALSVPALRRLGPAAAAASGWAGLGLVAAACVELRASTPFPGAAALAPVLGTAAVLAGGCSAPALGAGVLLERRLLQWLGTVSYTLYLWHWPVLVLAPSLVHHPLDGAQEALAVAVALVLAATTTVLVERPVRLSRWLAARPGSSLLAGSSLALGAGALVVLVASSMPPLVGSGTVHAAALGTNGADAVGALVASSPQSRLAPRRLAALGEAASTVDAAVAATVERSLHTRAVPANVTPPLAEAATDEPSPFYDGCFDGFTDTTVHPCLYGDTGGAHSVVLFGDSHALMWFPALDAIATAHHDQLVALAKATCPPLDLEVFSPDLDEWYTACDSWRAAALARIEALHPAVVVLGFSREYGVGNDHVLVYGSAWMRGLAEMIEQLRATGAKVVVIGPVPYPPFIVPDCLAAHLEDPEACTVPNKAPWYNTDGVTAERAVVLAAGASYIDVNSWFCAAGRCATMVANMVAYRDDNHVSMTYARWLTPAMAAQLELATGGTL